MPSPIGHALSGVLLYDLGSGHKDRYPCRTAFLTIFFALLPDIDFVFGFFVGNPNKYHHQFTHSFAFVILVGLVGAILFSKRSRLHFRLYFVLFIAAGLVHIFLDLLAVDTSQPYGAPIFWPLSNKYYISPLRIFSDVQRSSESGLFFKSLLNLHNLKTVLLEIIILGPITIFAYLVKKKRLANPNEKAK